MGKAFTFSLSPALDAALADEVKAERRLREVEEVAVLVRQLLSDAMSAVVKAEAFYDELIGTAAQSSDGTVAGLQQTAFRISAAESHLKHCRRAHSEQQRRLLFAEQEVVRHHHELLKAHSKVQAFETLRDRQRAEFLQQQARSEEAELEEIARHTHKRPHLTANPHDVT